MCTSKILQKCSNCLKTFIKESYGISSFRYKIELGVSLLILLIQLICIHYYLIAGNAFLVLCTFTVLDILIFVVRRMCMKMLICCLSAKVSKSIERYLLVLATLLSFGFLQRNFPDLTWIVIENLRKRYTFRFILWLYSHIPLVSVIKQPELKRSKLLVASTMLFLAILIYVVSPLGLIRIINTISNTYCRPVKTDCLGTITVCYTEIDVKLYQDVTSVEAFSKSQMSLVIFNKNETFKDAEFTRGYRQLHKKVCPEYMHIISTNMPQTYKFKTHVSLVSKWSFFKIKNLLLPQEFNDYEVLVDFDYITNMKHVDKQHTQCLTCRTPNKTCETSGTSKKCYLSFYVYHAYSYGDYHIILHKKNAAFFHPLRIRLLPMIDHLVLDYIPNIFLPDLQRLAAEMVRNESVLLTDDVQSLIYSIDTEVFAVGFIIKVYFFSSLLGISVFYFIFAKEIVRYCDTPKFIHFDQVYDIYISFSNVDFIDRYFAEQFLIGYLKECGFLVKSCQDVEAGRNLLREYSIEIPRSKKVLIVWSSAYEADETCFRFQFESIILELRRQGNFKKEDIFILVIDEHELPSNYILLLERNNIYDIKVLPDLTDIAVKAELKPLITDIRKSLEDDIKM